MDTVYIDGKEIKSTWGLNPLYEKFYSSLMQFPDIKDRVSNDYTDENGIEIYYTKGYLKPREPSISLGIDTYAHYLTFMDYITSKDTFVLSSSIIGSITLEYVSTSDFDSQGITFEIKVKERNFNDR